MSAMQQDLKVLTGKDVDVLAPFPPALLKHAVSWLRCHPTLTMADNSPKTDEEIYTFLQALLQDYPTYAIVDKANLTHAKTTDIPVVGLITFSPCPPWNGYIHVASSRSAWGDRLAQPGLVQQGMELAIQEIFESSPDLLRISASPLAHNAPACALAKRLGFRKEGHFEDAVLIKGQPRSIAHFGLSRVLWDVKYSPSTQEPAA